MNLNDRFSAPSEVVSREVGGETVLLDLAGGSYFGLDSIGGEVWRVLEENGITLDEACNLVMSNYDVDRAQVEQDLTTLFRDLAAKGLVLVEKPKE